MSPFPLAAFHPQEPALGLSVIVRTRELWIDRD